MLSLLKICCGGEVWLHLLADLAVGAEKTIVAATHEQL
jgi:hypothetical protein